MQATVQNVMRLIRSAISGAGGSPNWDSICRVVSIFEENSAGIVSYLSALGTYVAVASHAERMNACMLIDYLFKNAKPPQLKALQSQNLIDTLKAPGMSLDPHIHNFLYKVMPEWLRILRGANILNKKFEQFLTDYIDVHYAPCLTPKIRAKFVRDLTGVTEVLSMFGDCLLAAGTGTVDKKLLSEIVANVQEITRRLVDLEPTIVERELRGVVIAARDCADVTLQLERDWSQRHGPIDGQLIQAVLHKLRKSLQIAAEPKKPLQKGVRTPPRAHGVDKNDITDQEFFEKLTALKQREISSAPSDVGSLLDLGEAVPAGVNPFVPQEPPKDDLLDLF